MNVVTLTGYVGQDPDVKYTSNGKAVANISLGVKKNFTDGTNWIKCTAWGKIAELFEKNVRKGSRLLITGELNIDYYEKDGVKCTAPNVDIQQFEYMNVKIDTSEEPGETTSRNKPKQGQEQMTMNVPRGVDDELPFN